MIGGLESVKAGDEFPEADVVDGVDGGDGDACYVCVDEDGDDGGKRSRW